MEKTLIGSIMLSLLILFSGLAWAAGPPVVLTHTMTGYSAGDHTAGLDISILVSNPGDVSLTDLELSLAPTPPFFKGWDTLEVSSLAPHQSARLSLHVEAPLSYDKNKVTVTPLHFTGKYKGADGKLRMFPAMSRPGGAK
jgi:hypothetical protein